MPLVIVETGTGVTDANSYASEADVRAYAAMRGIVVPSATGEGDGVVDPLSPLLILAMDYLLTKQFQGEPVSSAQPLQFPRWGVSAGDWAEFPPTTIPPKLVQAQCQLVIEQIAGTQLSTTLQSSTQTGPNVVREKVDVIETEYTNDPRFQVLDALMPKVDALLVGITRQSGFDLVRC